MSVTSAGRRSDRFRKGPSLRSKVLYGACRWVVLPIVKRAPINEAAFRRAAYLDVAAGMRPPAGIVRQPVQLPGFEAEIVRARGVTADVKDGVVLYLHGGGFMCCGMNTHRSIVSSLAKRTRLPIMHVGYRQLPATSINGSIDDCLTAYRWLLSNGARPEKTVFAGDSAGGFLTFATALRARAEGVALPAGLVGISPLLDLDCTAKLAHANADRDVLAPVASLVIISELDAQHGDGRGAAVSPVDGDLAGLPPALLIVAESEVMRCDAELMAERLAAAGVPCDLQVWDGMVHAFPAVAPRMPESRAALRNVTRFINSRIFPS